MIDLSGYRRQHIKHARARGSAMSEMVLVLPLLVFVLMLLLLFGQGWMRVQHATVMSRYEAWRQAAYAPGPYAVDPSPNDAMNQLFFAGNAATIEYQGHGSFPRDAADQLADWVGGQSDDAREFIEAVTDALPAGHTVSFKTTHPNSNQLWTLFDRPIRHTHTRLANDWRFVNGWEIDEEGWHPAGPHVSHIPQVRDQFFEEIDERLTSGAIASNPLSDVLRHFYFTLPGYAGPEVALEWDQTD